MQYYIIAAVWLFGFLIAHWMLRVEHEADNKQYTHGDRLLSIGLSVFSVAMVLFLLISAWIKVIAATGYWARPVKKENKKS